MVSFTWMDSSYRLKRFRILFGIYFKVYYIFLNNQHGCILTPPYLVREKQVLGLIISLIIISLMISITLHFISITKE